MKKPQAAAACAAFVFAASLLFAGCGGVSSSASSSGASSQAAISVSEKPISEAAKKDVEITIAGTSLGKDYASKDILIVEYKFTNNTSKAESFTLLCQDKAFQNGIECSSSVISDAIDSQKQLNDVKPGTTYTLKVGYELQDVSSPVDIEITSLFGGEKYLTQQVKLK